MNKVEGETLVDAWKTVEGDMFIRNQPDLLQKISKYSADFEKSLDNIATEFENVPANFREGWVKHLEFRTKDRKVVKDAGRAEEFNSFISFENVPPRYTENLERFRQLVSDPDQGEIIKTSTMREAVSGLELENQGIVAGISGGQKVLNSMI